MVIFFWTPISVLNFILNLCNSPLNSLNHSARNLRIIRLSELGALGRDSEKGTFFNVTAMISSLKADGALYKVKLFFF